MNTMIKVIKKWSTGLLVAALMFSGCSLLDPNDTENLETTEDDLGSAADGATETFSVGLESETSILINNIAYFSHPMADDYSTVSDGHDFNINDPRSHNQFNDEGYQEVHNVRALADFVIETVIPNDNLVTDEQSGLVYFYRGISYLLSAENFYRQPIAPDTPTLTHQERLTNALEDFDTAFSLNTELETALHLLRARTYRLLGNKVSARSEAEAAIASGSDDFVYWAQFDADLSSNEVWGVGVGRLTQDLQPLPRLDFLDPKYVEFDAPIAVVKMEEAHLILAEVNLADGDLAAAQASLKEVVRIASGRPREDFEDIDTRLLGIPQVAGVLVKADANAPSLGGLTIPRSGNMVSVPIISASSLTDAVIDAAAEEELLRQIYLSRQEMFFNEGRRSSDLGMRRQMSREEYEQNDTINSPGDPGTEEGIFVPSFIPDGEDMDVWSLDETGPNPVITILWDMNKVLADNRNSNAPTLDGLRTTLPFDFPF